MNKKIIMLGVALVGFILVVCLISCSPKCEVEGCDNNAMDGFSYCEAHKCSVSGCGSLVVDGYDYCAEHKCNVANCNNKKIYNQDYCESHECAYRECHKLRADDSEYCCEEHKKLEEEAIAKEQKEKEERERMKRENEKAREEEYDDEDDDYSSSSTRYMSDMSDDEITNAMICAQKCIRDNLAYNAQDAEISYLPHNWNITAVGNVYVCGTTIQAYNAYGTKVSAKAIATFTMTESGFKDASCIFE